jgi:membrane protein DedA with SNARE-associated domain
MTNKKYVWPSFNYNKIFLHYRQFALFAYIGAFLWTVTFLILGYFLGHEWYLVAHFSNRIFIPLIILSVLILFLIVYLKEKI